MEEHAVKPPIPVSGDAGRYTMACGRAAVARVGWHIPEGHAELAVRYQFRDCRRGINVTVLRLNQPVVEEAFDADEHPMTGVALDALARDALNIIGLRAA